MSTYNLAMSIDSTPGAPYSGTVNSAVSESFNLSELALSEQSVVSLSIEMAASEVITVSPIESLNVFGEEGDMSKAVLVYIASDAANVGNFTVEPTATIGWTNVLPGSLTLRPDQRFHVAAGPNDDGGGFVCDDVNHELTITNASGAARTVHVLFVGDR